MNTTATTSEFIALHEATHAVVAVHLRVPIESVSINQGGIQGDALRLATNRSPMSFSERDWDKRILIRLAPEAFQSLCFEPMDDDGCGDDVRQAEGTARDCLQIPTDALPAYMADARKRVMKIVQRDNVQLAIRIVAEQLLQRQVLTGQDITDATACIVGKKPSMRSFAKKLAELKK